MYTKETGKKKEIKTEFSNFKISIIKYLTNFKIYQLSKLSGRSPIKRSLL